MPKVSVIVPVYNVEKYIDKCLNSLVNQTLKDIEIIVVNDGSPDKSQKIIDKYSKKHSKLVKSFIKENGGLSDARNYGVKKASGEYIGFVDGDDFVRKDMFEKLYNKAKTANFDIVVCDINYVYDDHEKYISSLVKNDVLGSNEVKKNMLNIYPAAWNKIYKKELFNNVNFKKNVWFEDVEFLYRLFPFIKSIGVVKDPLINYVQRAGAITKTFDKRLYHYIDNWNGVIKFYKENNFYHDYFKELEYCYVRYLYATFISQAINFDKIEFDKAVMEAKRNVKEHFPKYRKNKYFYKSLKGIYLLIFNSKIVNLIYRIKKTK